jgi:hypothetical protein
MSSKSAAKKSSSIADKWIQCARTGLVVAKSSSQQYGDIVGIGSDDSDYMKQLLEANVPLLFVNEFYARMSEHPSKELNELFAVDSSGGQECFFDYAFMNPVTMRAAGLRMGDVCELSDASAPTLPVQFRLVVTCWPLSSCPLTHISLSRSYTSMNQLIWLSSDSSGSDGSRSRSANVILRARQVDKQRVPLARRVLVDLLPDHYSVYSTCPYMFNSGKLLDEDWRLLNAFLRARHMNKCLLLGQLVYASYMGKRFIFRVKAVDSRDKAQLSALADELNARLAITDEVVDLQPQQQQQQRAEFIEGEGVKPRERPLCTPTDCFMVGEETTFSILIGSNANADVNEQATDSTARAKPVYADCGGLEKEIETLKEFFVYPFERVGLYKSIGVEMSKGVLLYGPPGCGKTMLARATCNEAKCTTMELNIAQVFSKNYGETEEKLKKFFADAWLK